MQLRQDQLQLLAEGTEEQAADLILELPTFALASQALQVLRHHPHWPSAAHRMRHVLAVTKEPLYVHHNYLNSHRLALISQLFRIDSTLDPLYFKQDSAYVLLAVTEGFLTQPTLTSERLQQVRHWFGRALRKEGVFWGLGELQDLQVWLVDKAAGRMPSWNALKHEQEVGRIDYLLAFLEKHGSVFPGGGEEWSVVVKLALCLREDVQADRKVLLRLLGMYLQQRYHPQITLRNMKFLLEFFKHPFNEKECQYYPQRAAAALLANYSQQQLQNSLSKSALGTVWESRHVEQYFLNCIKMGITESTCRLLVGLIRYLQAQGSSHLMLGAVRLNLTKIFIFMKHPKFFLPCFKLLKHFVLGPPPEEELLLKLLEKAPLFADNAPPEQRCLFVNFLQTAASHYHQLPQVKYLQEVIDKHTPPGESGQNVLRLSEEEMRAEKEEYGWKVEVVAAVGRKAAKSGLRGLSNIGNSCYLNSFLQSLFMNREFAAFILQASTLDLSRSLTKTPPYASLSPEALSKRIREDLKPLLEVQKLFALLLKSTRNELSPLIVRNISPQMFRNTQQHDTIEFGRSLLDQLACSGANKLFEGELTTSIECGHCGLVRNRKEVFLDYIVAPQQEEDLEELLRGSFKEEVMGGLTCDHCGQSSPASIKRHCISQPPKYLIITIKRFEYDANEKKNRKIMGRISMKEEITVEDSHYQLYSLIVHRGYSPNAGHYFTFSRTDWLASNKWVCHNDSVVTEHDSYQEIACFLDNNESDTPYILFYYLNSHIANNQHTLSLPLALRPPQQQYVLTEDAQSSIPEKKPTKMPLFDVFSLMRQLRKDEDDDDGPGKDHFNNPIA